MLLAHGVAVVGVCPTFAKRRGEVDDGEMRQDTDWEGEGPNVSTPDRATAFLAAVKVVLRPIVKAMVARGVTLPALVDALKEIFVDVAERDFELDGKRSTDSRISILTGVHRKDVRALRSDAESRRSKPIAPAVSATVIGRWLGDPDFFDQDGGPTPLPRQSTGDEVSFETLVERVSKDVRPRTILDELVRLELVEHGDDDVVTLLTDAFVPRQGDDERLGFFKLNLHDHAAAATENLLAESGAPPFLERVVYYSHLTPTSVDVLEARARRLAGDALLELNKSALALQKADAVDAEARERFRFGVYFFRAQSDQPDDDRANGEDAETTTPKV